MIEGCSPWVHASTFRDNAYTPELSRAGAALLVTEGSRALVQGNLFEDNEVGGSGHGGAVYVDRADPALQGNTFRGNRSAYGGALVTSLAYGPVVGNTFEGNRGEWEGGAIALVSSALVLANNTITDNESILDGGGVHVCVTCDPHANPAVVDNHITGNRNTGFGAAGLGAAYLRALSGNDLHDNTQDGAPADLAWHNEHLDLDPAWAHSPSFSGNWWGTTDAQAIEQTIHDGLDEDGLGVVGVAPADGPVAEPRTRAFAIPQKIRFTEGDTMPVYLTLYNPGPAREVELLLMVSYEDGPPLPWTGALAGAEVDGDRWRLELAEDEVRFAELTAPELHTDAPRSGAWIAVLFDPDTGERLAEPATGRFELGGGR